MYPLFFFIFMAASMLPSSLFAKTKADQAIENKVLIKSMCPEPTELDPQLAGGLPEKTVLLALFEGPLNLDPKDCTPSPGLAYRWDISQEGTVYTLHLRPEAQWSDGTPLTAEDFVFSAQRILSPRLASGLSSFFHPLKNAKAYHNGDIQDFNTVGIHALDAHTLQIELEYPLPYFLQYLASSAWYPVPKHTILAHGSVDDRHNTWTHPSHFISNGSFYLKSWDIHQALTVEKNPYYWDAANVKLNAIHFLAINDLMSEERAFRSGHVHLTEALPLGKYKALKKKKAPELFEAPALGTYCYAFNTQKKPFDDKRVRLAFSLALNRSLLVDSVVGGGKTPAYAYTPPHTAGYTPEAKIEENLQKAKDLLSEAGYPDGKGFPRVRLLINSSDNHRQIAEVLQAVWLKELGIKVDLLIEEWKVFLHRRKNYDFEIVRANWMGDYLDPHAFLEVYLSDSPNNWSRWHCEPYDQLVASSNQQPTTQERYALLQEAETLLLEELPLLLIYHFNTLNLRDPRVKGWYPNILNLHPYPHVYFEEGTL